MFLVAAVDKESHHVGSGFIVISSSLSVIDAHVFQASIICRNLSTVVLQASFPYLSWPADRVTVDKETIWCLEAPVGREDDEEKEEPWASHAWPARSL